MSVAQRERAALVDTLRGVGPDAPTLCEGWKTRDLAAHLVIREYRPDAAPGIVIPFFAQHTEKVQDQTAETEWGELVDKVASGPPVYSPLKLLDAVANVAEMFIHHEDVRRAQPGWNPRELEPALAARLRRTLPLMARVTLAKVPGRVALRTPEGKTLLTAGRGPAVTVTGAPEELLLFAVGRSARVEFDGDASAVQAVRDAPKGL
ncbi:TIGR03085 family protein [Mycobacterium sp. 852002-53434_SCH5985345]|uniref:TIGR03085 family metal-binding protein n=1 Tax=unclassified Mycobacterium TaxID=2642494 RepID=UPI0007FE5A93|nr:MULTISPECIES: TIGR03085 family metal-binding protein [unclassified Mycobacterium]OBF50893.1 TIGR03085 family protein [Mycobacterium sp. 852002-53434_SCH5985345]OBF72791.1 TIGR03085 family protein [Mycobacterium sp. 852002-51613_SCH5001154]OBF90877.1 TIGR03085 family protein [Mycobacterium sp. 852014-52450_SCH5900713]